MKEVWKGHELSNGMFGIKSVHEDGMFLTHYGNRGCSCAATRFMKRRTIMDQNI
jgi:large subunit ribosomal protein L16